MQDYSEEDKLFNSVVKPIKQKRMNDTDFLFDPVMLDYTLGDKTSIRLEGIKSIVDENERIEAMAAFIKEIIKQNFPEEFYPWIARDALGLKYKKWEIADMKRKYKIKKKRELKKIKDMKNKKDKYTKDKTKKPLSMTTKWAEKDNPFILTF